MPNIADNKHMSLLQSRLKYLLNFMLPVAALFIFVGCEGNTGEGFQGLEDILEVNNDAVVEIVSSSPTEDPVVLTSNAEKTFAVQVNSGAGDVEYTFELDGSVLQRSTSPFYNLSAVGIAGGTHEVKVTATNSKSSDSHIFNVRKNTPPTISLDANTSQSINCEADSFQLDVLATDVDGDSLTYNFYLNGSEITSYLTSTSSTNSATTVFTPDCTLAGNNNVVIRATDEHGEYNEYSMAVTVANPNIASIDTYSPGVTPVVILSTGSQVFSVAASGKAPLIYEWLLDNVTISGATNSIYDLSAAAMTPGTHTLTIKVTDSDSSDSHTFNIIRNAAPVIDTATPTDSYLKVNYTTTKSFDITTSDGNGDTLSYSWTLDSGANAQLTNTDTAVGSSGLLTPLETMLGNHTVKVVVSDGYESAEQSWQVDINRFSNECNQLAAGQICTIVGQVGFGQDQVIKKGRMEYILEDPDNPGNLFVSDPTNHVVWYYNNTVADITKMGILVPAYDGRIIVGNGASGITSDGLKNDKFKLWEPRGMDYRTSDGSLFIADKNNHRIVQILSDGTGRRVMGLSNRGTTNNASTNDTGILARNSYVRSPYDIKIDNTNNLAYVACTDGDYIKEFNISDVDYVNWTSRVLVGVNNGSGVVVAGGSVEGTTDFTLTSSRTDSPTALALSADGNTLFFVEWNASRLGAVNLTATDQTYFNGAITVPANQMKLLLNNGTGLVEGLHTALQVYRPRGLALYETGGVLQGFFISNYYHHRVMFINNTAGDITVGNELVPALEGRWVFGNGTWGFNGTDKPGNLTYLQSPRGLALGSGGMLYVASGDSGRVQGLQYDVADGVVTNPVTVNLIFDYIDSINPNSIATNRITNLKFNPVTNEMYFNDLYNGRLRKFNTITGDTSIVIDRGRSNIDQEQTLPQDTYVMDLAGMTIYNGSLLYADKTVSWATQRHCLIRAINDSASDKVFWGTTVQAGRVATIAGSTALGCHYQWDPAQEGNLATDVRLMVPDSIFTYNNELYISNERGYCIQKVAVDGTLTTLVGTCGAGGDVNGAVGGTDVRLYMPSEMILDPQGTDGSFFFVDRSFSSNSKLKYVNRSTSDITIAGSIIPAGFVGTVLQTTGGYTRGIAVFDNWICYTSGYQWDGNSGAHNVQCFDRTGTSPTSISFQIGPNNGDYITAGKQFEREQEGVSANLARLYSPVDLEFDNDGNLYITENLGNVIRMVKRWW